MSFLVMGVKFEPTSLVDLKGKWTVGLRVWEITHVPTNYSISWRPRKTFMVRAEGSGTWVRGSPGYEYYDYDYYKLEGSVSIGFYKYFRASSSFSPFSGLAPYFETEHRLSSVSYYRELSIQTYGTGFDIGIEYFFTLYGKQLSLRLETSLLKVSRTYEKKEGYSEEESSIRDYIYFHLPGNGSLSTWLCFHF